MLASFVGWGRAINRALRYTDLHHWGLDAAAGIAFTVLLGGLANLLRVFSAPVLVIFTLSGAALWAGQTWYGRAATIARVRAGARRLSRDALLLTMVAVFLGIVAVRFAAAPTKRSFIANPAYAGVAFNPHDDMHAYLVHPEKILQTGHLAPDPFNARQMETSLGGAAVLTAIGRAALPLENLHLVEEGVGLLALCGVLAALLHPLQLPARVTLLLLIVGQCSLEPNLNLSSFISGAVLLGAMLCLLLERDPGRLFSPRWSVALGFFAAGVCALKSTLIPLAAILVVVAGLIRAPGLPARRSGSSAAIVVCTVLAALAPWMVAKYQAYGTPLYPLFGFGHHWRSYLPLPDGATRTAWELFWRENHRDLYAPLITLGGAGLLWAIPRVRRAVSRTNWAVVFAISGAWLGTIAVLGSTTGGYGVARYVSPLPLIGVPVLFGLLWPRNNGRGAIVATALWFVAVAGWCWNERIFTVEYLRLSWQQDFGAESPRYPMSDQPLREQAARIQAAVPPGEKLLVRLTHPFLLDFRRNPVFVADWPGAVSPPPGWPAFQGPEVLASYLESQDIRFVAYSYAREANYPRARFGWAAGPDQPRFERQLARLTLDFQESLSLLGITRPRIYDDGAVFVLDLASGRTR